MLKIEFQVDKLIIAHIMQERGIKDYGISREKWNTLLKRANNKEANGFVQKIQEELTSETSEAGTLMWQSRRSGA